MSRLPVTVPAFEAIALQGKSVLFQELTALFQNFMEGEKTQARFDSLNVSALILKHTGVLTSIEITKDRSLNASVIPLNINLNNPLHRHVQEIVKSVQGGFLESQLNEWYKGMLKDAGFLDKTVEVVVDRKNSKLKGLESVKHEMFLNKGLFLGKLTAAEAAAITLHEIGHVFNYYEWLLKTATTSVTLDAAWKAFSGTTDEQIRIKIVDYTSEKLQVPESARFKAEDINSKKQFYTLYLTSVYPEIRSNYGQNAYDARIAEQAADQFAARHGSTRELAVALDKLYGFGMAKIPTWVRYFVSAFRAACVILSSLLYPPFGVFFAIILLIGMTSTNADHEVYDDQKARNRKLINEIVVALKDPELKQKQRQDLINDHQVLTELDKRLHEDDDLYKLVWRNLTSHRRDQHALLKFQQDLERLTNNDLYVKAQSFNALLA